MYHRGKEAGDSIRAGSLTGWVTQAAEIWCDRNLLLSCCERMLDMPHTRLS
jgi:hypothetical protein